MATLIVHCRNCQKEVTSTIDLSAPAAKEIVDKGLKDGAVCEACAAGDSQNVDDECYFGKTSYQTDLPPLDVPQFIMDKYVEVVREAIEREAMFSYDPSKPGKVKFIAGKPGTKLQIRCYKPLPLPTEPRFTEGEIPKPYPKLEFEEVDVKTPPDETGWWIEK